MAQHVKELLICGTGILSGLGFFALSLHTHRFEFIALAGVLILGSIVLAGSQSLNKSESS